MGVMHLADRASTARSRTRSGHGRRGALRGRGLDGEQGDVDQANSLMWANIAKPWAFGPDRGDRPSRRTSARWTATIDKERPWYASGRMNADKLRESWSNSSNEDELSEFLTCDACRTRPARATLGLSQSDDAMDLSPIIEAKALRGFVEGRGRATHELYQKAGTAGPRGDQEVQVWT